MYSWAAKLFGAFHQEILVVDQHGKIHFPVTRPELSTVANGVPSDKLNLSARIQGIYDPVTGMPIDISDAFNHVKSDVNPIQYIVSVVGSGTVQATIRFLEETTDNTFYAFALCPFSTTVKGKNENLNVDAIANVTHEIDLFDQLHTLIEAMQDPVFLKDAAGRWQVINKSAKKLFRLDGIDWHMKNDQELAILNPAFRDAHLFCVL